jgi:hypothetical protein
MTSDEFNIETVAGMSAGDITAVDLAHAVVIIANTLLELKGQIKSGSGVCGDGPDLTIQDIMDDSRKSYATVYRWIQRGLLPRNRADRNITVRRKDYEQFKNMVTS